MAKGPLEERRDAWAQRLGRATLFVMFALLATPAKQGRSVDERAGERGAAERHRAAVDG